MPKSLDVSDDLSAQLSRHRAIIGRMNENREAELEITGVDDEGVTWRLHEAGRRNSAFLTQMVEEARKNSKKS